MEWHGTMIHGTKRKNKWRVQTKIKNRRVLWFEYFVQDDDVGSFATRSGQDDGQKTGNRTEGTGWKKGKDVQRSKDSGQYDAGVSEKKLQTKEPCVEKKISVELSAAARGLSVFNDMVVPARAKKHPRIVRPASSPL